jgi:hypothetical protein
MKLAHLLLAGLAGAAASLFAEPHKSSFGPPLICFQYDIGSARSLPWSEGNDSFGVDPKYSCEQLVPDTLAVLDSSKDVLVHMETIRRATIYASRQGEKPTKTRDTGMSDRLVIAMLDRALKTIAREPQSSLAWLDAGYAIGGAVHMGSQQGASFLEYFEKARAAAPSDLGLAFAACAAYLDSPKNEIWERHFRETLAGAPEGSLLRKNALAYGENYLGKEKMEKLLAGEGKKAAPSKKTKE